MTMSSSSTANGHAKSIPASSTPTKHSIFTVPAPIKRLFDTFPLITYEANELPLRSQQARRAKGHAFFCWSAETDAPRGAASFNPLCLRWQAYMKSRGVPFYVVASSNHASISERLPFLALNASDPTPFKKKSIVSTQELSQWATDQNDSWPRELDTLYDSYMSLLDNEIRRAWLYHMYLTTNFNTFTAPSYIGTQTTSSVVRFVMAWELKRHARLELEKYRPKIDFDGLYESAELAFSALDNLIGRKKKLSVSGKPSLLEATLYAYLYLLLELPLSRWSDSRLVELVMANSALVAWQAEMKEEFGDLDPPAIYTL